MFFTTKQYLKAEKYIEVIKKNRKKHHITRDNNYGHEIHLKSLQRLTDIVSKMNNDQRDAFNVICAHLTGDDIAKTAENPKGQLRMMLSGEGGTGKSFLIEAIDLFTKLYFPTPKGSEHGTCIIGAPTGKAALNVNGHTIENLFNFPFLSLRGDKISDPAVQKYYQDRFSHVQLLILDEVSMMGLKKLHKIHQILCCAKQTSDNASCRSTDFQSQCTYTEMQAEHSPLGGMHFLFCGDFYQLDPVKDMVLYSKDIQANTKEEIASEMVYMKIDTYKELKQQMRQNGNNAEDDKFRAFLSNIRKGKASLEDLDYLNHSNKYCSSLDDPALRNLPNDETLTVTPFNGTQNSYGCEQINAYKLEQRKRNACKNIHIWARHTFTSTYNKKKKLQPNTARNLIALQHESNCDKLTSKLILSKGTRVMLRHNLSVTDGLVNGSLGTVHSIIWPKSLKNKIRIDVTSMEEAAEKNQLPPIVLVKFDNLPPHVESFLPDEPHVIPIPPQKQKIRCETGLSVTRHMTPLIQADCVTIHKSQGQSVKNLVCVLNRMQRSRGLFYVAASRATSSKGLFLVKSSCMHPPLLELKDFNGSKPDTYNAIHEEYARLSMKPGDNLKRIISEVVAANKNYLVDLYNLRTYTSDDEGEEFMQSCDEDST
jgi:hypothetical protein